jgi:hypothetical protein
VPRGINVPVKIFELLHRAPMLDHDCPLFNHIFRQRRSVFSPPLRLHGNYNHSAFNPTLYWCNFCGVRLNAAALLIWLMTVA